MYTCSHQGKEHFQGLVAADGKGESRDEAERRKGVLTEEEGQGRHQPMGQSSLLETFLPKVASSPALRS